MGDSPTAGFFSKSGARARIGAQNNAGTPTTHATHATACAPPTLKHTHRHRHDTYIFTPPPRRLSGVWPAPFRHLWGFFAFSLSLYKNMYMPFGLDAQKRSAKHAQTLCERFFCQRALAHPQHASITPSLHSRARTTRARALLRQGHTRQRAAPRRQTLYARESTQTG